MSLVTRFSAFFLITLGMVLAGFSACVYYLAEVHLYQNIDKELRTSLNRISPGPAPKPEKPDWAVLDEKGAKLQSSLEESLAPPVALESILASKVDVPESLVGLDGKRYRLLTRRFGEGRDRRGPPNARGSGDSPEASKRKDDRGRVGGGALPTPNESQTKAGGDGQSRTGRRGRSPMRRDRSITLAVWSPLAALESDLRGLGLALSALSAALWGLAAAIGRWIGRRALAPLEKMAEAARGMPWLEGADRLPNPGTRDELEDFAKSFNGLLERLQIALERQKQFTGQASHQLRTPLAGLIAAIEVARRRPRPAADYEQTLDRLHEDALRLWRIVEALLFLARADAESALPDLEVINLQDFVHEQVEHWSQHPRASDLEACGAGQGPLLVRAHRPLLAQLLDNLIENALKYSKPGKPIVINAAREGDVAAISVQDEGQGVPEEDLPRIFEPFYRSEQARKQGHPGVGLGLAIVKRIATVFRGEVQVESALEAGCKFTVLLPLVEAGKASAEVLDKPAPSGRQLEPVV